jgi:hypothetical protein
MTLNIRMRSALAISSAMVLVAGCKKKEEPVVTPPLEAPAPPAPTPAAVASIDLGKAIDASKKVTAPTTTFGRKDTIYVSVATTGTGATTSIAALWTYGAAATKVNETSQTLDLTGPATNEFHIEKKTPWPVGKYKVDILLNGTSAGTKEFEIK